MAQIAIKGHATRGKEVIEILEIFGGKNIYNLSGDTSCSYYVLENGEIRCGICVYDNEPYTILNLEEFLEKFPYKVGDEVLAYHEGILAKFTVQDVRWNSELNKVEYKICSSWLDPILIRPYKEETMEEREEKAVNHVFDVEVISFDIAQKDKYELDLQGKFKVVLRKGKYYVERIKPQYPKTYEECYAILNQNLDEHSVIGYRSTDVYNLQLLLICRDAYWEIAGEEMGLSEPWEPSANDEGKTHALYYNRCTDSLDKCEGLFESNAILDFPTEEMRDAFFENFKDLIEKCKELL
jgi:hypothetical protein